jgi:hypothetical protein
MRACHRAGNDARGPLPGSRTTNASTASGIVAWLPPSAYGWLQSMPSKQVRQTSISVMHSTRRLFCDLTRSRRPAQKRIGRPARCSARSSGDSHR